ncbi:MAG: TetR family transcriptional regulator [Nocardioidaceae bacterium]
MSETIAPPGLRERKKQATRRNIKQAALALAVDHGLEHLTVEAISEAADVSPRTFFNYFGCKEEALVGENEAVEAELRETIRDRPAGEPVLRTLRAAVGGSESLRAADDRREEAIARQRLVRDNPSLLPRQLGKYAAYERALCEALSERLGVDADADPRPALLAALAVSVIRVAIRGWTADGGRPLTDLVDEAFDVIEEGL